jgi:hypothetical protein
MRIILDQQDLIDAVCVMIATRANGNVVTGSEPEFVRDAVLHYNDGVFWATGYIYGDFYRLNQEDLKNAVAVYLRAYHSFDEDRMLINLTLYPENPAGENFEADVIIQK